MRRNEEQPRILALRVRMTAATEDEASVYPHQAEISKSAPQGLKPLHFGDLIGTTKVVPFHKTVRRLIGSPCNRNLLGACLSPRAIQTSDRRSIVRASGKFPVCSVEKRLVREGLGHCQTGTEEQKNHLEGSKSFLVLNIPPVG